MSKEKPVTIVQLERLTRSERAAHGRVIAKAAELPLWFLAERLKGWPLSFEDQFCWNGPPTVWHEGRECSTAALMIEYVLGVRLHPSWWVVRHHCCGRSACINPHHHMVTSISSLKFDGRFVPDADFPEAGFYFHPHDWDERLPRLIRELPEWKSLNAKECHLLLPEFSTRFIEAELAGMRQRCGLSWSEVQHDITLQDDFYKERNVTVNPQ